MIFRKYLFVTLLLTNIILVAQILPKPVFSKFSGYYNDSVVLNMSSSVSGSEIRFTLNGNEPTINSELYVTPLILKNKSHNQNTISIIPTNPSFSFPKPGYDSLRANNRGWLPPYDTVFKATVVKAKIFKQGLVSDSTTTHTFLIQENGVSFFSLPVLSISMDSISLFDNDFGIYVYGNDSINEGNYSNDTAYRKAFVEFFETNGNNSFSQYVNINIHGNGGRHAPQKSLRLKAEKEFGKGVIDYQFFPEFEVSKFDKILLRNSGHRPDCIGRDDIGQELLKSLSNISQHNRYCIVLINGEYWGIQTIKEIIDDNYFYRRYNMPKTSCVILTQSGTLDEGYPGDEIYYSNFLNFLSNSNLSLSSNYNYASTQIDFESFIDFQCAEIFLANGDWPNNNTKFWRYKTNSNNTTLNNHLDGRLRWLFYDLDATFGGDCSGIYPSNNTLIRAVDSSYSNYTLPLRKLLTNPQFKIDFINRYADLLNSNFLPSQIINSISKTSSQINSELLQHVNRWRYPSVSTNLQSRSNEIPSLSKWNSIITGMTNFANLRAEKSRKHFMNYFSLIDTVKMTLNVNDTLRGKIKINSLYIDKNLIRKNSLVYPWTGIYFNGNPISLEAIAFPGYKFSHWNFPQDTNSFVIKNVTSDTLITAHFEKDTTFNPIHFMYINEVLASNNSNITDEYFENDDWIEFYNPNNFSVDLSGFFLSDDLNNKTKFIINSSSQESIIPAKGFKLIWADDDLHQGLLHANFKINSLTDTLFLTLPDGVNTVDSVIIQNQQSDKSFGRKNDGDFNWILFDIPTPNASNLINEFPEKDDLIVYPNPTSDVLFFTKTINVSIYNLLGQLIANYEHVKKIDASSFPVGMYILKSDKGEIIKFIKR